MTELREESFAHGTGQMPYRERSIDDEGCSQRPMPSVSSTLMDPVPDRCTGGPPALRCGPDHAPVGKTATIRTRRAFGARQYVALRAGSALRCGFQRGGDVNDPEEDIASHK